MKKLLNLGLVSSMIATSAMAGEFFGIERVYDISSKTEFKQDANSPMLKFGNQNMDYLA